MTRYISIHVYATMVTIFLCFFTLCLVCIYLALVSGFCVCIYFYVVKFFVFSFAYLF